MFFIEIKRFIPYSKKKMFFLVNDIENYPKFLYNCKKANISYKNKNEIIATLDIYKGSLNSSFTTKNFLFPYRKIEMHLLKGPLKDLKGFWKFNEINNGCIIELKLIISLNNSLINTPMKFLLDIYSKKILKNFSDRAKMLYG